MAFKVRQTPVPAFGQSAPKPTLEGVQQQIDQARYPSQLRGKKIGPNLARLAMSGDITIEELDATFQQIADKRESMRPTSQEPPETAPEPAMPAEPGTPEWSPTANLGEPRTDFDPAELAAGEHLDRLR